MDIKEFKEAVEKASGGLKYFDFYTSADFQCDYTGGMPVCMVWSITNGKCWLEYPEFSYRWMNGNDMDVTEYEQILADWGVRDCQDETQFNSWLDTFGEENVKFAYYDFEKEEIGYEY